MHITWTSCGNWTFGHVQKGSREGVGLRKDLPTSAYRPELMQARPKCERFGLEDAEDLSYNAAQEMG